MKGRAPVKYCLEPAVEVKSPKVSIAFIVRWRGLGCSHHSAKVTRRCMCLSVLSLTCPLGGSAVVLHTASCFLPLLLEKDFRPPKGVIPNAKQHWRQPSFFCLHVQLSLCHQSNPLVFPSLSHTHSFSRLHTISVPTLQSLLVGFQHCPSSPLNDQTADRVHTFEAQCPLQAQVV